MPDDLLLATEPLEVVVNKDATALEKKIHTYKTLYQLCYLNAKGESNPELSAFLDLSRSRDCSPDKIYFYKRTYLEGLEERALRQGPEVYEAYLKSFECVEARRIGADYGLTSLQKSNVLANLESYKLIEKSMAQNRILNKELLNDLEARLGYEERFYSFYELPATHKFYALSLLIELEVLTEATDKKLYDSVIKIAEGPYLLAVAEKK
jgi:hypothetical protein